MRQSPFFPPKAPFRKLVDKMVSGESNIRGALNMTEQNNENKSPKQEKQIPLIERWANDPNPCGFSTPAKNTTSTIKKK